MIDTLVWNWSWRLRLLTVCPRAPLCIFAYAHLCQFGWLTCFHVEHVVGHLKNAGRLSAGLCVSVLFGLVHFWNPVASIQLVNNYFIAKVVAVHLLAIVTTKINTMSYKMGTWTAT